MLNRLTSARTVNARGSGRPGPGHGPVGQWALALAQVDPGPGRPGLNRCATLR